MPSFLGTQNVGVVVVTIHLEIRALLEAKGQYLLLLQGHPTRINSKPLKQSIVKRILVFKR